MKIQETKIKQNERLKEVCVANSIKFDSMVSLLESVKTKKLMKRNNYHQQKINDEIEKSLK